MKPTVPPSEKAIATAFSLKPKLFKGMEKRVRDLGYPWTKSSYVAALVMADLEKAGVMSPEEIQQVASIVAKDAKDEKAKKKPRGRKKT